MASLNSVHGECNALNPASLKGNTPPSRQPFAPAPSEGTAPSVPKAPPGTRKLRHLTNQTTTQSYFQSSWGPRIPDGVQHHSQSAAQFKWPYVFYFSAPYSANCSKFFSASSNGDSIFRINWRVKRVSFPNQFQHSILLRQHGFRLEDQIA